MNPNSSSETLQRIRAALEAACNVLNQFTPGEIEAEYKSGHDPVTLADRAVDATLRKNLLREGEGWLSEESADDLTRLEKTRVWVVDPLDGTREFVAGIPEFCVSVAMVENGLPIAGGICNPVTRETIIGSVDTSVTVNGQKAHASQKRDLQGALVLASRSEVKRGEWELFKDAPFRIQAMGSVAYKLSLVASGRADITFTLTPKHEWDVAAGAALVLSAGGFVQTLENAPLQCNQRNPLLSGLIAGGPDVQAELLRFLQGSLAAPNKR
jgi:myo-inositol-1(or 4)-monophosphatase